MRSTRIFLSLLMWTISSVGCDSRVPTTWAAGLRHNNHAAAVMSKTPAFPTLRFTGLETTWPPRPEGRRNETILPLGPENPGSLTKELRDHIPRTLQQDPQIRPMLGDRYALVGIDELMPPKNTTPNHALGPLTAVIFFSYSNNATVQVWTQGFQVLGLDSKTGSSPHSGAADSKAAIKLARADRRLKNVGHLVAGAILTVPPEGANGYGHRLVYVTFGKDLGSTPSYSATVDLTQQRVLSAGPAGRVRN